MKNIILLIFISLLAIKAQAQNEPQWFKDRVADEVSRVYHKKSFVPHKDVWKGQPYKLINLYKIWVDTDKQGFTYLNNTQRQQYKLRFENGRIWDARGNEFDTRGLREGGAQFVMTKDGSIYASRKWVREQFEHHSLVAGEPVVCAGKMVIHNGRLKMIDDISAQYPTKDHYALTRVVTKLRSSGVAFSKVKVIYNKDFQ
jgi:hypothetical protein